MPDLDSFMNQAREHEKRFDWLGAVGDYESALKLLPKEASQMIGDTLELKAYALFRTAFQSDSHPQFIDKISQSVECYGRAA